MTKRTVEMETAIYNTYRKALTTFRKNDNGRNCRAADRRNRARKIVVERYNIPFTELKELIARHDAVNGITHDKTHLTPKFLAQVELKRQRDEFEANNPLPFCECGNQDEVARLRAEPNDWAKHIMTPVISCSRCYFDNYRDVLFK